MKSRITKDEAEQIAAVIRANARGLRAEAKRMAQAAIDGDFDYTEHGCILAALYDLYPEWRALLPVPEVGGGQGRDPWNMEGRSGWNVINLVIALVVVAVIGALVGWVVTG